MTGISFQCTNPNCSHQVTFPPEQAGMVQHCPHCGQRLIVPGTSVVAIAPMPPPSGAPPAVNVAGQQSVYHQHERSVEQHMSRTLKMGQGCFAMLAVMFAIGLVGWGVGNIVDAPKWWSWTALIAGLAGVVAFVFFGYYATETAEASKDHGRR